MSPQIYVHFLASSLRALIHTTFVFMASFVCSPYRRGAITFVRCGALHIRPCLSVNPFMGEIAGFAFSIESPAFRPLLLGWRLEGHLFSFEVLFIRWNRLEWILRAQHVWCGLSLFLFRCALASGCPPTPVFLLFSNFQASLLCSGTAFCTILTFSFLIFGTRY